MSSYSAIAWRDILLQLICAAVRCRLPGNEYSNFEARTMDDNTINISKQNVWQSKESLKEMCHWFFTLQQVPVTTNGIVTNMHSATTVSNKLFLSSSSTCPVEGLDGAVSRKMSLMSEDKSLAELNIWPAGASKPMSTQAGGRVCETNCYKLLH